MRLKHFSTLLVIVGLTLTGCGGGGGGGSTSPDPIIPPEDIDVNVTITGDYQVESLGTANTINASISLGNTAKDLYLVLSNSAMTSGSSSITHNAKVSATAQAKTISSTDSTDKPRILHHPQYVDDFNSQIGTLLSKVEENQLQAKTIAVPERMEDIADTSTGTFYRSSDMTDPTEATARKVISVGTDFGVKTLNIWVSDDSYGIGCEKAKCVTQAMVDALADTFLKTASDNDIYDWVTNIYGEEWGSEAEAKYSYLIPANDEITILLTDIDDDGLPAPRESRVVGFFWAKDNFDNGIFSGSNERVMFYIDSVLFANGDTLWSIDDAWPKEIVSTLAHEFQHMIHYYQKNILRYANINDNTDTWINEMLSESTEDIIATKIGHNVEGRYPIFNENNTLSLTSWNNQLADYAKVNVYGAYLLRNYGGAQLLHDIMHNSYDDEQAVVYAVNQPSNTPEKTFADLLSEWGVAVMLSDHDNLDVDTPVYNIGTLFEDVYGSTTYEMRSINLFNYIPQPTIYTTSGTVQAQGNYYYKIGDNLTGDIDVILELNGQTEATLIAK